MKVRVWLGGWLFLLVFSFRAMGATVHFAHLSDPHLFDAGDEKGENRRIFKWCIRTVNEKHKSDPYSFVVVTGDLGLEGLAPKGVVPEDSVIEDAAKNFAGLIGESNVPEWWFVPGNNDLVGEKPETIQVYYTFMDTLKAESHKVHITDLSPRPKESESGYRDWPEENPQMRFIGFNNASFKSNDNFGDATTDTTIVAQNAAVKDVEDRLKVSSIPHCYIFYHIPEIADAFWASLRADDPDLLSRELKRNGLATAHPRNAWTVDERVRDEWKKVLTNNLVQGLFAGHFHFRDRSVYKKLDWAKEWAGLDAESRTFSVLQVAPPIAIKKQEDVDLPARGYREVTLNPDGPKPIDTHIEWYPPEKPCTPPPTPSVSSTPCPPPVALEVSGKAKNEAHKDSTQCLSETVWIAVVVLVIGVVLVWRGLPVGYLQRTETGNRKLWISGAVCLVLGTIPFWICQAEHPQAASGWESEGFGGIDLLVRFAVVPALAVLGATALYWLGRYVLNEVRSTGDQVPIGAPVVGLVLVGGMVLGFAALGTLANVHSCDSQLVLAVGALWALASAASGGAVGFLFGLPRPSTPTVARPADPAIGSSPAPPVVVEAGTNLEEISNWLSKLVVGGTLFEASSIKRYLHEAGEHFALTVSKSGDTKAWSGVGSSLVVYFGLLGLFGGYLLTQIYLSPRRAARPTSPTDTSTSQE